MLIDARQDQIASVVAIIDALPDRGEADTLIMPFRAKIAEIAPPRPLKFSRLLFIPADPVIINGAQWRRGMLSIPRTAIQILTEHVQRSMPEETKIIENIIAGQKINNKAVIATAGDRLWPAASRILTSASMPADWKSATGLSDGDYATISSSLACILKHATIVQGIIDNRPSKDNLDGTLRMILNAAAERGPDELATIIVILIQRMPDCDRVMEIAKEIGSTNNKVGQKASERAAEYTLESLTNDNAITLAATGIGDISTAAKTISNTMNVLSSISNQSQMQPAKQIQADELRRSIDKSGKNSLKVLLEKHIFPTIKKIGNTPTNEEMLNLEDMARDIGSFGQACRKAGSGNFYDEILKDAATRIMSTSIPIMDRLRLIEIMGYSKVAIKIFEEHLSNCS